MGKLGEKPDKSPNDKADGLDLSAITATVEDIEATEEFSALEQTLDQLDSCLNNLELKNDTLNSKLKELLDSTLQIHQEMTAQRQHEQSKNADTKDNPSEQ